MGYKFKPVKGVGKRMRITKSGKVKHRHEKNSHLRSRRSSGLKRRLGRASVLHEGHAKNMRRFMGEVARRPEQARHERELAAAAAETAAAPEKAVPEKAAPEKAAAPKKAAAGTKKK